MKAKDDTIKILCAWCGTPISSVGLDAYYESGGCDTCNYGSSTIIEITCTNPKCIKFNKVIYKKES